jgi:hypothetical protein
MIRTTAAVTECHAFEDALMRTRAHVDAIARHGVCALIICHGKSSSS